MSVAYPDAPGRHRPVRPTTETVTTQWRSNASARAPWHVPLAGWSP